MRHLTGYGENTTYFYWLATPDSSNRYGIYVVNWLYGVAHSGSDWCGVRPVVVLSGVTFAENEVGNLEIQ